MPNRLARAIRHWFEQHLGDDLAYESNPEVVLQQHVDDGVGAVWNLPYAHKPEMSDALNAAMAEVTETYSGPDLTVVTGCTAHPADRSPGDTIRKAHELHGAKVVKLHCSVGDFDANDERLGPVYETAGELAMPVVVHVGHGVDGFTHSSELAAIERVAEMQPETALIVAHCGHHGHAAALALMERRSNVWADLTPVVFERPALTASEVEAFSDRLLLGSDAPNVALTLESQLTWLRDLDLSEETLSSVLGRNAQRLVPVTG